MPHMCTSPLYTCYIPQIYPRLRFIYPMPLLAVIFCIGVVSRATAGANDRLRWRGGWALGYLTQRSAGVGAQPPRSSGLVAELAAARLGSG